MALTQIAWRPGGWLVAFFPNGSDECRRANPERFHCNWSRLHPVYLTDEYLLGSSTREAELDDFKAVRIAAGPCTIDAVGQGAFVERRHAGERDDVGCAFLRFAPIRMAGVLSSVLRPNAEHPCNREFPLDLEERGGHVRPGYTADTYRALFEPIGFNVEEVSGLGGAPGVQPMYQGDAGTPRRRRRSATVLRGGSVLWLDSASPRVPFSLYARARKSAAP